MKDAASGTIETIEATGMKKRSVSRMTPYKVYRRMLIYPQISNAKTLKKDQLSSFTLGRLLIT